MHQNIKKLSTVFSCLMVLALMFALFAPTGVAKADDSAGIDNSGNTSAPVQPSGSSAKVIYPDGKEIVPDHYIVVYKAGYAAASTVDTFKASVAANGGSVSFVYDSALNGFAAYLPEKALNAVLADPNVDFVEADSYMKLEDTGTQSVSAQTVQTNPTWGLDRIDQRIAPGNNAYSYSVNGAGVNVYVIDTGVRITHKQFGGRATFDYDAIDGSKQDCNGHGTHVAGTIGGSTYGVAKGVSIHAIRVLDCEGSGTTSQVVAGINWVASHRVKPAIASMSLGGDVDPVLDAALNNMINKGVITVVAAGNDNDDACYYSPARVPNAITVGATTDTDWRAGFSNYGTCVDIFAPGVNITSSWNSSDTDTATISGTSMATPHVSGVAALYLQTHKAATVSSVTNILKRYATSGLIQNPGAGSPNKMLYSLVNDEKPTVAVLVTPHGTTTDTTPLFKWGSVQNATQYQLTAYKGTTVVVNVKVLPTACSGYTCSYTQPTALPMASYTWKVRAFVGSWQAFTSPFSFVITGGTDGVTFYSPFTSNALGWSAVQGTWAVNSGSYNTEGVSNYFASAVHSGVYETVAVSAKMKRVGNPNNSNGIIVRGSPSSVDPSDYMWNNGYFFFYVNSGYYCIWKAVNGEFTPLVYWTYSPDIKAYDWNTLQVKAQGTQLKFYINNHLVAYGTEPGKFRGQLGLTMYNGTAATPLMVDAVSVTTTFTMGDDSASGAVNFNNTLPTGSGSPFVAP